MSDQDFGTERDRNSVQDTPVGTAVQPNTSIKITISANASAAGESAPQLSSVAKDQHSSRKTKDLGSKFISQSGIESEKYEEVSNPPSIHLAKLNPSQSASNRV